jgi:SAM-dependent methyltransferase
MAQLTSVPRNNERIGLRHIEAAVMSETALDEKMARDYEAVAEPLTLQYIATAFALVGGVGPGTRVLDVAAGTGGLSVSAAEAGAQVLATDKSVAMVARLSERLEPYPNCVARVMDGQALESADGAFDATFSMFGVVNFPDWRLGLRELARVTRRGGHGCVSAWCDPRAAGPVGFLFEALRATFPDVDLPPPSEGVTLLGSPDSLREEMTAAGFKDVEVLTVDAIWTSPSVDAFLTERDQLYGIMPMYATLPQAYRDRLLPALRRAAEGTGADGAVQVKAGGLIAAGRVN